MVSLRTLASHLFLAVVAAGVVGLLAAFGVVARLEALSLDLRIRSGLQTRAPDPRIVIAWIDQDSIDALRRDGPVGFPWPRSVYADALAWWKECGAKVVAFDLLIVDPMLAEDDSMLAEAIANPPPVVLASKLVDWRDGGFDDAETARLRARTLAPADRPLRTHRGASLPLPELEAAAAGVGFVNTTADADQVFRRYDLLRGYDGRTLPSFAVAVASVAAGDPAPRFDADAFVVGDRRVPVDADGRLLLNFRGPEFTYDRVKFVNVLQSAANVAEGKAPLYEPQRFRDRIVVVGVHAEGMEDVAPSPTSARFLGPELHATAIDALLNGDALRDRGALPWLTLIAALAAVLAVRTPTRLAVAIVLVVAVALAVVGGAIAAFAAGDVVPLAAPLLGVVAGAGAGFVQRLGVEGRGRRELRRAFASYMAPEIVAEVLRDPSGLQLGGRTQPITVMFADLSGFTRMAERMAPAEVVAFLNDYFTRMGDHVMAQAGVIDKFIGDAIMALFGAPAVRADHAAAALRASLAMLTELDRLNVGLVADGRAPLGMRIGLHTGPAVVGNMGSIRRFDYTAIGDTVNLASRLEGAGKAFGVRCLISEATAASVADEFACRPVGRLKVVGRDAPVRVFEPIARHADLDAAQRAHLAAFDAAMAAVERRAPDAVALLRAAAALRPNDPVAQLHLRLAADPAFDGVLALDGK